MAHRALSPFGAQETKTAAMKYHAQAIELCSSLPNPQALRALADLVYQGRINIISDQYLYNHQRVESRNKAHYQRRLCRVNHKQEYKSSRK